MEPEPITCTVSMKWDLGFLFPQPTLEDKDTEDGD